MAPPKKMTLHEFFTDESFGGSWADDDIDLASISVPIEKNRPFGSDHHSGGFHNNSGSFIGGPTGDNGPPYIVKLLHLPVTCNDSFVDDLFQSRYTPYVKFKIVADPVSNILETHVIKKVAFVELTNYDDYSRALKWSDLYYKENRRVVIEPADFQDFQNCISFNQEHEEEIEQIVEDFIAGKNHENQHGHHPRRSGMAGMPLPEPHDLNAMGPGRRMAPITSPSRNNIPLNRFSRRSSLHSDTHSNNSIASPPLSHPATHNQPSKPKSNPFGAAKPVDVVAKEKELDETIDSLHHNDPHYHPNPKSRRSSSTNSRRPSVNILKRPEAPKPIKPEPASSIANNADLASSIPSASASPSFTQAKPPSMSLADILSAESNNSPVPSSGMRSTPVKQSPKTAVFKPVILRKKTQSNLSPMPTNQNASVTNSTPISPPLTQANLANTNEQINDKASQRATEAEIENKLKQINESLSKHSISQGADNSIQTNSNIHGNTDNHFNAITPEHVHAHISRSPQRDAIEPTGSNRRSSSSSGTSNDSPAHSHAKPRIDLLSRTRIAEPNKSYSSAGDRPNFKQHFNEMTKKANVNRDNRNHSNKANQHNKSSRHQARRDGSVIEEPIQSIDASDNTLTESSILSLSRPPNKTDQNQGRSLSPNRSPRYNNRHYHRVPQQVDETTGTPAEGIKTNGYTGHDTEEVIENVRALALKDENLRSSRGRGRGRGNYRGHRGYNRGYNGGYGRGGRGNFSNEETVPGAKEVS